MIIQSAREDPQSELRGVGFKAFDITDAKPLGPMGEEALEILLQHLDAPLQSGIAVREDGLIEIHVSPIMLGLLA